jgi:hypothetical protein
MIRKSYFFGIFAITFLLGNLLFSKPINKELAQKAAFNQFDVFVSKGKSNSIQQKDLELVYQEITENNANPAFYIFATNQVKGFVIVAGDDAVQPILAWSDESDFTLNNQNPGFKWFLRRYSKQINQVMTSGLMQSNEVKLQWQQQLDSKKLKTSMLQAPNAVAPLIKTKWNQGNDGTPYNDLCPEDKEAKERTLTGCVATAFAQLMMHYKFPAQGKGAYQYTHQKYGVQQANFGSTKYNWDIMPMNDELSKTASPEAKNALATIMYHCGVSIDMAYDIAARNGSGALTSKVVTAFTQYFGYKNTVREVYKKDYTDAAWIALLKAELDAKRPMEYAGNGNGGGHSFICDGYDAQNRFHMNWGWGGQSDGYFAVNNLAPGEGGAGAGSGNYNEGQDAIIGVEPDNTPQQDILPLSLNSNITLSKETLSRNEEFTVEVSLKNNSSSAYTGALVLNLLDSKKNKVAELAQLSNFNLASSSTTTENVKFNAKLNDVINPGNYLVSVAFIRDNKVVEVVETTDFKNNKQITVSAPTSGVSQLILASEITLSNEVRIDSTVTITAEITNLPDNDSKFSGEVMVKLLSAEGNLLNEIGNVAVTDLDKNASIEGGVSFTFKPTSTLTTGKYMIAFYASPNGQGTSNLLLKAGNFQNPLPIDILPTALKDDKNEPNNTRQSASPLKKSANPIDSLSIENNFDDNEDVDFYVIDFPTDKKHLVTVRVEDLSNSTKYTGLISAFSSYNNKTDMFTDGNESEVINDTVSGEMYIEAEPSVPGFEGTYNIVVTYKELIGSSVEEIVTDDTTIELMPNPASNELKINSANELIESIRITNTSGQEILETNQLNTNSYSFDVSNLPQGAYLVVVKKADKSVLKKIRIVR